MARSDRDVLRSVKKWLAQVLGDDWTVELDNEGDPSLPFARVARAGATQIEASHVAWFDSLLPISIMLQPKHSSSQAEGLDKGEAALNLVTLAVHAGVRPIDRRVRNPYPGGTPRRIPIYDYSGANLAEGSDMRRSNDFVRVRDFSGQTLVDPDDQKIVYVAIDLRLAWRRVGAVPSNGRLLERLDLEEDVGN